MAQARRRSARRRRLLTVAGSLSVHAAIFFAFVSAQPEPPRLFEPEPIRVQLVTPTPPPQAPAPKPDPAPSAPAKPAPVKPPPPRHIARPTPNPPPDVVPLPAGKGPSADGVAEVSDAEIAGAATAGSGGAGSGGGACNMTRWLQGQLRKDRQVQAAMAEVHRGKAIRVWNGDWVRHPGQEGDGLAAVREAIMWEVAFAPVACRAEPVHGLVLISLADGPGASRLVMGSGVWRWSDLLRARSVAR